MSDGPARFAVSVRTQLDKYGEGIEFFVGYNSVAEGQRDLVALLDQETFDKLWELLTNQIHVEHGKRFGGQTTTAQAVSNLQAGGMNPQPVAPAQPVGVPQPQPVAQAPAAPAPVPAPAPAAPAAPAPAPVPQQGPSCVHGPRVFRQNKPGASKQWAAWFCPTPKGTPNQCEPEWA